MKKIIKYSFSLALFSIFYLLYYYFLLQNDALSVILIKNDGRYSSEELKFTNNHKYLINANVAQYSSYIITEADDIKKKTVLKIITHVKLNNNKIKNYGNKSNFKCIVKLLFNSVVRHVELEAFEENKFATSLNRKFVFLLDPDELQRKFQTFSSFINLEDIVVAVIWKNDYQQNLDIMSLSKRLAEARIEKIILPYSLIKFQKPKIIKPSQPRLNSLSLCVHYTYAIPSQIINWFDLHLSFGVREIMIYDAIDNKELTKLLKTTYGDDERIVIIPYEMNLNDLCNQTDFTISNYPKNVQEYLIITCKEFYKAEFKEKIDGRSAHEEITSNDCFTVLREKHEFIGYYDLDEFVFPRSMDATKDFYDKNLDYTCESDSQKSICESNSFLNENIYDYLNKLIEIERNGRDRNELGSIRFLHAIYLPERVEKQLINLIGSLIEKTHLYESTLASLFPTDLYLSQPPFKSGHLFNIKIDDLEYINYLYKHYNRFALCTYEKYLKNATKIDTSLIRYLYYVTEGGERARKEIHYYKNVKSIFTHFAEDYKRDSWISLIKKVHGFNLNSKKLLNMI